MNIFIMKSFTEDAPLFSFLSLFELFSLLCTALQLFQDQIFTLLDTFWNINHSRLDTITPQGESSICYCHTT